ncbi:Sucrose phosphorylase [Roseovarius sp. THAF9]|uniref:alpha-amylase family glycosyl hydrolase n=1 Tax=Roseovarius sp. THAF9 TaxID=2587847 RepID=UPI0012A7A120|nr:alpha-amylase family glycosyl hydrolase [Roseovarius sp. THAF9]QFT92797.1 Sucrose phosphorylase [Roseovarius sp. THAF9]
MLNARLRELLSRIYPDESAPDLARAIIAAFWPEGTVPRKRARTPSNRLWSEKDAFLITYGDTILDGVHKPLDLLEDFLSRYMGGVVDGVHVLPFFPFSSDDGFAVTDYCAVNPRLGEWSDITRIASNFHLVSDLVLNHVSSQGNWFNQYRQGKAPYDKFFYEADPDQDLSAVVRPRTTPLLQKIETRNGDKHVWCTFSHDQIDLNFSNPEVLLEMLRIIRMHIDKGVRTLRLDAVAFIWKEPGTSCIHLPQTHAIVQLIRLLVDYTFETVVLLTETNVPRSENLSYFGNRNEAHAVYNFPLPPLILHAMQSGSAEYLNRWQATMPPAQLGCAYLNFTASHDGIGMRPAEGVLPLDEKNRMIDTAQAAGALVSMRTMPDGTEQAYELNCSLFDVMRTTFKGEDDHHFERFICSQTIPMSLEGIPAFYIHSFLATPSDHEAVERRGMNRAINRHRWHYPDLLERMEDERSDQARVMKALSERLRIRARQPGFHPNATQFTLRLDPRLFGVWRQSLDRYQSIFAIHNVSDETVTVSPDQLNMIEDDNWRDLLSGEEIDAAADVITLAPYQSRWIANREGAAPGDRP